MEPVMSECIKQAQKRLLYLWDKIQNDIIDLMVVNIKRKVIELIKKIITLPNITPDSSNQEVQKIYQRFGLLL